MTKRRTTAATRGKGTMERHAQNSEAEAAAVKSAKPMPTKPASPPTDNTGQKQNTQHLAEYQFKPGQSGNPTGRPPGSKSSLRWGFVRSS